MSGSPNPNNMSKTNPNTHAKFGCDRCNGLNVVNEKVRDLDILGPLLHRASKAVGFRSTVVYVGTYKIVERGKLRTLLTKVNYI